MLISLIRLAALSVCIISASAAASIPSIVNELSPSPKKLYNLLFTYSNDSLKNEAIHFYASMNPGTGELNSDAPVVWRRVTSRGKIIKPKLLHKKKMQLLFKYVPQTYSPGGVNFYLTFQLYKPGTQNHDPGINVSRQFAIQKNGERYQAFLLRPNGVLEPITQMHASIHFRDLGKALMGDPSGTNAYWTRVTYENGVREYIVSYLYQQYTKSMPQKSDPSFRSGRTIRFTDPKGAEIPVEARIKQ